MVLALLLWWLLRSPWGRAFAALRDNPIRAESLGVNITAYTLLAFAIGAACAGIAGVYYASLVEFIEPGPFHFSTSLLMLLAVIVGGSGRFFGPVIGTVIIILLPELLRASNMEALKFMQKWYLVFFGVAVVIADDLASRRHPVDRRSLQEGSRGQMTPFLEVKDMKKPYGAIKAVDGVSFAVAPGEIVGVIGPNGSGKTTLFNSILGQIKPTSGHVEFCGEDITGMAPLELAAPRRRPHVPDAAGIRQALGARQSDRRRAGVQGHARLAPAGRSPMRVSASTPTR